MMDRRNNNARINGVDKQDEIRPETSSQIFHNEIKVKSTRQTPPENNTQRQLKKYSRTMSETDVGYRPASNTAKLKRVLSETEIKTRLAGCPKGLLITTEPPKSGETYRRRSNTDVKAILRMMDRSLNDESVKDVSVYQERIHWQQEKKELLLELASVKREREQLEKENERLQEELENRNKVIDHLVDFMNSSLPGETQPVDGDLNETLTNSHHINRTQAIEKV